MPQTFISKADLQAWINTLPEEDYITFHWSGLRSEATQTVLQKDGRVSKTGNNGIVGSDWHKGQMDAHREGLKRYKSGEGVQGEWQKGESIEASRRIVDQLLS